jgi:acyl carrier protein
MPETAHPFEARVRATLAEHARLPVDVETLQVYDDLFQAGMTSHASVNVMLALEEEFDIEFPEEMLQKSTFESVEAICNSIASLSTIGDPA